VGAGGYAARSTETDRGACRGRDDELRGRVAPVGGLLAGGGREHKGGADSTRGLQGTGRTIPWSSSAHGLQERAAEESVFSAGARSAGEGISASSMEGESGAPGAGFGSGGGHTAGDGMGGSRSIGKEMGGARAGRRGATGLLRSREAAPMWWRASGAGRGGIWARGRWKMGAVRLGASIFSSASGGELRSG
jgi:hypothetical protein